MNQDVDYSKVCAACSTPMTSPPRDGADSMCAYLHTKQGARDFGRILEGNLRKQSIVNKTPVNTGLLTSGPDEVLTEEHLLTMREHAQSATIEDEVNADQSRKEYMREYMRRRRAG